MNEALSFLSRSQVNNTFNKLMAGLSKPFQDAARTLLAQLDESGAATSEQLHRTLFPLADTKSASAQLTKLLKNIVDGAQAASLLLDYQFEGAKSKGAAQRMLRFLGSAVALVADLEGLRSIPPAQIIVGQAGKVLGEEPTVLLVTFNTHEHREINRAFCGEKTPNSYNEQGCVADDLGSHGGMRVLHVFSQQGTANAQEAVNRADAAFRPHFVIACGIAFGVDLKKQSVGDVLISECIVPYELARMTKGKLQLSNSQPPASAKLFDWTRNLDQRKKTGNAKSVWPELHFGKVLSGDKLVDDETYRDELIALAGTHKVIGGEMEGAGVHKALSFNGGQWIVIKAICDWADGNKNNPHKERDQQHAATNTATVVKALLDTGWLSHTNEDRRKLPHNKSERGERQVADPPDLAKSQPLDVVQKQKHFALNQRARETELRKSSLDALDRNDADDGPESRDVVALDYIHAWACKSDERPFFALLGETGMGKTTTAQRLVEKLNSERNEGNSVPLALYFDLRKVDAVAMQSANQRPSRDVAPMPISERTIHECIGNGWLSVGGRLPTVQEALNAIDAGALVIYDGLDEVLSRIGEREGLTYTQGLLRTLEESRVRRRLPDGLIPARREPKLIVSCRSQFFRTLAEQDEHLLGERRGANAPDLFRALQLKKLTEAQIRQYFASTFPDDDVNELMARIASIHNLRELAARPFTLTLVADFLPRIEAMRESGTRVTGAMLYREVAREWLIRDKQKQTLRLEDKEEIASELAWRLCKGEKRGISARELEKWLNRWIADQGAESEYVSISRDVLYEDLRNSTFLKRIDHVDPSNSRFEFAHTSLFEFFLAMALLSAVRGNQRYRWAIPTPSLESMRFLGELLDSDDARGTLLDTLSHWRMQYVSYASELQLAYVVFAYNNRLPMPQTQGFDLQGAQLSEQVIGTKAEPVGPMQAAPFNLRCANLINARLIGTLFHGVDLRDAHNERANLRGAEFLACVVDDRWTRAAEAKHLPVRWARGIVTRELTAHSHASRILRRPTEGLGDSASINCVSFSSDGDTIASAGDDGTLRAWSARSGHTAILAESSRTLFLKCAFSPDGRSIASACIDGTLWLTETSSGGTIRRIHTPLRRTGAFAFAPNCDTAVGVGEDGRLELWNMFTGHAIRKFDSPRGFVLACTFSPDGRLVATVSGGGTLEVWDVQSGSTVTLVERPRGSMRACAFSPDGATIVSGGDDATLRLWDVRIGTMIRRFDRRPGRVRACVFSPDGSCIASSSDDGALLMWDVQTGRLISEFTDEHNTPCSLAFSPDGRSFASGGADGTIKLWDLSQPTHPLVRTYLHADRASAAWTPDGQLLHASGRAWRYVAWQQTDENGVRQTTPIGECSPWGTRAAFEHNAPI